MTTVLITGVAGLLGSRFADWVHENHPEVAIVGVDDLSGGYLNNVGDFVNFYQIDVASTKLNEIFDSCKPDIVYHMAAYAAEGLSPFIRKFNYTNNLVATANIINNCIRHNVKRLVFTSSMAVYGNGKPPFNEKDKQNPTDPYGIAKYACELDIMVAGEQHGLDWCILRPHNVYGEKQNIWDSYRNFLGICTYKILVGDKITIYGDGLQTRAFSYIGDSLEPMWKAGHISEASKQIINIGSKKEVTILDAAITALRVADNLGLNVLPEKEAIVHLPPRFEVKHAFSTYEKSEQLLDFKDRTTLDEGLRRMIWWAMHQPKRERFVWKDYELNKGIYEYWKQDALKDGFYK